MSKVTIRSHGAFALAFPLMAAFLAAWAIAAFFLFHVAAGRRQALGLWVGSIAVYAVPVVLLWLSARRRSISIESGQLVWRHLNAQDVARGMVPSPEGSAPLTSVENIVIAPLGDLLVLLHEASHLTLFSDEFGRRRLAWFAQALAAQAGKSVEQRAPAFDEVKDSLGPELRAQLEARMKEKGRRLP